MAAITDIEMRCLCSDRDHKSNEEVKTRIEKTQTEVVRARHKIIWTGQDCPTGNSTRR